MVVHRHMQVLNSWFLHTYMYVNLHIYIYIYIYASARTFIRSHIDIHTICAFTCLHIYVYVYAHGTWFQILLEQ